MAVKVRIRTDEESAADRVWAWLLSPETKGCSSAERAETSGKGFHDAREGRTLIHRESGMYGPRLNQQPFAG